MDFMIAPGPSDKIALGLLIPSNIESNQDGFVKEFQFEDIT
jgi:hypothetical protein